MWRDNCFCDNCEHQLSSPGEDVGFHIFLTLSAANKGMRPLLHPRNYIENLGLSCSSRTPIIATLEISLV